MRKILIVGAGKSGLPLALSLLTLGYEVTVISARTPNQIRRGRPQGIPALFALALGADRADRLDLVDTDIPLYGTRVTVAGPSGQPVLAFNAEFAHPGRCTDPRVTTAAWLELAEQRGATVIYQHTTARDLDALTTSGRFDLAIVDDDRDDLSNIFDTDPARTVHDRPQRVVAGAYVQGLRPDPHWSDPHLEVHRVPGIGELFVVPARSLSGPCHALAFHALPGGPADRWWTEAAIHPPQILDLIVDLTHTFTPWVAERVQQVRLGDPNSAFYGRVHPRVRHPVAHFPSGGIAWGLGDTVIVNDPASAQHANLAVQAVACSVEAILVHGSQPFGEAWMNATFEAFWATHGDPATRLANALLSPPAPHMMEIFAVAAGNPQVARRFAAGLTDPGDMTWFTNPAAAADYLATLSEDRQPDRLASPRAGDRSWPLNARRRPRPGLRQLPTSRRTRP